MQKRIYDREIKRQHRQEDRSRAYADKLMADVPDDYPALDHLREMYQLDYYLENGYDCSEQELLDAIEACKIEAIQALWDFTDTVEVTGERPSTANALGRTAMSNSNGLLEPDAIGA
ncbi:MAG TPA: hypothetical protein VFG56_00180 [Candidatus Saccharimonadales bacterium]|nr:hypothetical protein [Candidatus Saccharimonadales bacterium]